MPTCGDLLKKATALQRKGDLAGAIVMIDRALVLARACTAERPEALKKRIYYLIRAGRFEEALGSADQMIAEAETEAGGMASLIGALRAVGYRLRVRVREAMGQWVEALFDVVRAEWHWYQAMILQGRTEEHTPERAAETLMEAIEMFQLPLSQERVLDATALGLREPDPEAMVSRFQSLLMVQQPPS